MHTLIAGTVYIGLLIAIANAYVPIAELAIVYAIAGIGTNLVSLTVEKLRRWGYNPNMIARTVFGNCASAFTALSNNAEVYAVAFQPNSRLPRELGITPLIGAYTDDEGRLYVEPATLCADVDTAYSIGKAEAQVCILRLIPDANSNERVYLLQDTPANRAYALQNAGGYTADGEYLLVYSPVPLFHFIADGEVQFVPVKGVFEYL